MKVLHVRVQRFDPKTDKDPHFESYTVNVNEGARVLHVLHAIHDEIDPTLSYRYCCGSGQCGSCAIRVDGEPVLACMKEATDGITITPLNLPVKKDLVVDLLPKIAVIASLAPTQGEIPVTDEGTDRRDKTTPGLHRVPRMRLGLPGHGRNKISRAHSDEAGDAPCPRPAGPG